MTPYSMKYLVRIFLLVVIFTNAGFGQEASGVKDIIDKIYDLEKDKDPKCYATANRLEDFMYGTPLTEVARNFKIELQKEVIYYLRQQGTKIAKANGKSKISSIELTPIIEGISLFKKTKAGDYLYELTTGTIRILKKDFKQYSSVSYGYRSLLSVEQDLLYFNENSTYSFDAQALEQANTYVNLLTLATLKVADLRARKGNQQEIDKELLKSTWITILNESQNTKTLAEVSYPTITTTDASNVSSQKVLEEIIVQKLESYKKYNAIAENVFLRNVQVYFAKQKWPTDLTQSNQLRSYYLESLIAYSSSLIETAALTSKKKNGSMIRPKHVEQALFTFLPSKTNTFEDVAFFPNSEAAITLESYDLDSFRDSGFHWRILSYALTDLKNSSLAPIDPNAAEIMVEGIAQMGVLVLRLAGTHSKNKGKTVLDIEDINQGFSAVQKLIDSYDYSQKTTTRTTIASSASTTTSTITTFSNVTQKLGIDFDHKSADWLNRLIRSYTVSYEEGAVKLAIPPAFGGSGVACEDINNDGLPDVLLLGGFGNKLYLNSGKGTFIDITQRAGLDSWNKEKNSFAEVRQPIIVDFNNDGHQDIFISMVDEAHQLYKNNGDATFTNVTASANLGGIDAVGGPATSFDYDNDGLLDLYIGYFGNYLKGTLPTLKRDNQNGMPNKLYRNVGNFVFEEVPFTKEVSSNTGWTQAMGHADINQDGWQDIIVGNDFGKNKYYLNDGKGSFTEMSAQLGTDKPSYTMNVGITDLNRDQFPDFYISNIVVMQKDEKYVSPNAETTMKFDPKKMANIRTVEANDLFLSKQAANDYPTFELSNKMGRGYSATGWSWDADFFDFDNDGDEDLYCLNGMNDFSVYSSENPFYFERQQDSKTIVYAQSNKEKNVFFVNEGGQLVNKAEELGADLESNARSASFFDYDLDGDLDIIINNYHEKATVLENKSGTENRWIQIKLIGDPAQNVNRDAIGSSLLLNGATTKNLWREIHSTSGYLSVHPKAQHFGLGSDTKVTVEVRWSNGETVLLSSLESNKRYEVSYPNTIKALD